MPKQNLLSDWQADFADLGIPETILKSAAQQIKDVSFSNLFDRCLSYRNLYDELVRVPFIVTDWLLVLLGQDKAQILKIIHQDNKLESYPEEVLYILAFADPQLTYKVLNANFDIIKKLQIPVAFLNFCARRGSLELVELCLLGMTNINIENTPNILFSMACSGNVEGVKHLLAEYEQGEYEYLLNPLGKANLLHGAAFSGSVALFNFCFDKYPNLLNTPSFNGLNCAHFAARNGGLEILQRVNELASQLFEQVAENNTSALHNAARSKNPNAIANLLKIVPDVDFEQISGEDKRPAIFLAAEFGTLAAVKFLMDKCPNSVSILSEKGESLLHATAASGSLAKLQEVWPHCQQHKMLVSGKRGTVLDLAIKKGNPEVISFVISNAKELLVNPLELALKAIESGNPLALEVILKYLEDKDNIRLLTKALAYRKRLMVEKVLEYAPAFLKKSDLLINLVAYDHVWAVDLLSTLEPALLDLPAPTKTKGKINILHKALIEKKILVAKTIYQKKPNFLTALTEDGCNSFMIALFFNDIEILEWVFFQAPQLATTLYQNVNALQHAIQETTVETGKVLQWILKKVPLLSVQKYQGMNILAWAVHNGFNLSFATLIAHCPDWLREVIEQQIDIENFSQAFHSLEVLNKIIDLTPDLLNVKSNSGCTILHFAAESGNIEVIKLVAPEVPQQVYMMDGNCHTLLHHVIRSKNKDAVEYVLKKFPNLINIGNPVLHFAIQVGDVPIVDLIIPIVQKQLDLTMPDGTTILSNAALSGIPEMFNEMLQRKPVLLSAIRNGKSYLHFAADSNHHAEMIAYLISSYPNESVNWWGIDAATKQTPDERIKKRGLIPTASKILTDLLKQAILTIVENKDEKLLEASVELLDAYKSRFFQLIYEYALFNEQQIDAVLQSTTLKDIFGHIQFKKLSQTFTLLKLQHQIANKPLTKEMVKDLVKIAKESVEVANTTYYVTKSSFCKDLIKFVSALDRANNLDQEHILTLSIIIQDYQLKGVNDITRTTDTLLLQALETSTSLNGLKPQPTLTAQRNIEPNTFLACLVQCRGLIPELDPATKLQVEKVFNGLEHIISHKNAIIQHVRMRYGVQYEVAKDLPIHTNHAPKGKPDECYVALERLIREFIAAFYLAHEAGHLNTFCHKISTGHCLEDIVREPLEWVSKLSEIQLFSDLMHRYYKEYLAYQKVMHGKSDEALGERSEVSDFILARHSGFLCKPEPTYAPKGVVEVVGVVKYLDVIFHEDEKPAKAARKK